MDKKTRLELGKLSAEIKRNVWNILWKNLRKQQRNIIFIKSNNRML